MMNKYEAQHWFWSQFGWTAYNESTVPDNAMALNNGRYITYEAANGSFGSDMLLSASLWHKSSSWVTIHTKAQEVIAYFATAMPPSFPIEGGRMKVRPGDPFAQDGADDDPGIRRVRFNFYLEFITKA